MPTTTTAAAVKPTMTPDSKGDMALFGVPSVVGAYNLTTGILIYSAFMILFLAAVGFATWQRAQYRNQFRLQQKLQMESGRTTPGVGGSKRDGGGGEDLSDAALFKQASISKRALMKDVGPGGVMAANDALKTKIASANGAGRSYDEREMANGLGQQSSGLGVRFGESTGATQGTGRTGGMKRTPQAYEMNSYGQTDDALSYYQDNHDTTDYSRPPLTESADPYYSSGSSHSGYLDQVEDYHYNPVGGHSPQMPKPSYQQSSTSNVSSPQPGQSPLFVQRTNSSRMPKGELHDGNNIFRSNSGHRVGGDASTPTRGLERNGSGGQPSRIATQGHLDRSGSGGNGYAGPTSPMSPHADGHAMSRSGSNASSSRTKVSGSPTQVHPTPIARSNSTRLPPSMRGGGAPQPSNLSQANNYM
ncbi:hypothetical protein BGW39_010954 [Mortierella sp. 14UC]|nr:hypothetical protein BGW39_010954 [Mortierella sp. 14UC]